MSRTLGAKNRPKRALLGMLQEVYGEDFHPIMEMAKIANDAEADLTLKLNAIKELAKYVSPQLRAIEHSGDVNHSIDQIGELLAGLVRTHEPPSER